MIHFRDYILQKQKKTRVDKCMQELMAHSGHSVWEIPEQHVLNFLIFKDTNGSGEQWFIKKPVLFWAQEILRAVKALQSAV